MADSVENLIKHLELAQACQSTVLADKTEFRVILLSSQLKSVTAFSRQDPTGDCIVTERIHRLQPDGWSCSL